MADAVAIEYLGCMVGEVRIGIAVDFVQEVFETRQITRLPGCPEYVLGMVNVRGNIVPVVDLWQIASITQGVKKVVILNTAEGKVGLLISVLVGLLRFDRVGESSRLPKMLDEYKDFFKKTGKAEDEYFLLEVDELITSLLSQVAK